MRVVLQLGINTNKYYADKTFYKVQQPKINPLKEIYGV